MGPNLPLSVAPGPHHLWETLAGSGAGRTGGEGGMMVTMVIREAGPEAGVRVTGCVGAHGWQSSRSGRDWSFLCSRALWIRVHGHMVEARRPLGTCSQQEGAGNGALEMLHLPVAWGQLGPQALHCRAVLLKPLPPGAAWYPGLMQAGWWVLTLGVGPGHHYSRRQRG